MFWNSAWNPLVAPPLPSGPTQSGFVYFYGSRGSTLSGTQTNLLILPPQTHSACIFPIPLPPAPPPAAVALPAAPELFLTRPPLSHPVPLTGIPKLFQEGGALPGPESVHRPRRHVLTKQETSLGRGPLGGEKKGERPQEACCATWLSVSGST